MMVKLAFLLRHETVLRDDPTFYDFVPYKYGPFSFALYRELTLLRNKGYVSHGEEPIAPAPEMAGCVRDKVRQLPRRVGDAVTSILRRYGQAGKDDLLEDVYTRYPWFASRSELDDLIPEGAKSVDSAQPAVYTTGYQGKSVDRLMNDLLRAGIHRIADVRANPISRKYGFARSSLSRIAGKLDIEYAHFPSLGIPGKMRVGLNGYESYQRLLADYERLILPEREAELAELARMVASHPTTLLCQEQDANCCHRSRLAGAVAEAIGLPVHHLP